MFDRGSFTGADLLYEIIDLHFTMSALNFPRKMKCFEFNITKKEFRVIDKILKPVYKWNKEYNSEGPLDRFTWSIKFLYDGKYLSSSGYNAYPDNYCSVIGNLQDYMEVLCKKYAGDSYDEEEAR